MSQKGGLDFVPLPQQYVGEEAMGGPTAAAHLKYVMNLTKKRKMEELDKELDGDQAIPAGKTLKTILVKPQLGLVEEEYLFDGVDDSYFEYIKPDKTLSNVKGEDDWILHFIINAVGFHVTNPSWWRLELVSKFQWYFTDDPSTPKYFKDWKHVETPYKSLHMKPALNFERYMIEETRIIVGEGKRNINASSPYLTRLAALIMYMLKLSMPEKKNPELQRLTYNRPGLLCGKGRDYIGSNARKETSKEVHQLVLKSEWDSGQAERDFDQDAFNNDQTPRKVKFMCEPLTGPFSMFNQVIPGTFNPEVVIKINKKTSQTLIVRPGSANGYESDAAKKKEDPKIDDSGTMKEIGVQWDIDFSQVYLRIPYVKQKPLDFIKTEADFFSQQLTEYHTDKMPHIVISNAFEIDTTKSGEAVILERILEWQNEWPTQFGVCFMSENTLRGPGLYQKEKLGMETNGIEKFQIQISGIDIFKKGPMDWRDDINVHKMIWETQMDYWGNKNNPKRHNSCVEDPAYLPYGQKWAWISLDPNYDGGDQAIERLDGQVDVLVWGKTTEPIRFICWRMEPFVYSVHDPVHNEWSGPDRPAKASIHREYPKCYNVRGGPIK